MTTIECTSSERSSTQMCSICKSWSHASPLQCRHLHLRILALSSYLHIRVHLISRTTQVPLAAAAHGYEVVIFAAQHSFKPPCCAQSANADISPQHCGLLNDTVQQRTAQQHHDSGHSIDRVPAVSQQPPPHSTHIHIHCGTACWLRVAWTYASLWRLCSVQSQCQQSARAS